MKRLSTKKVILPLVLVAVIAAALLIIRPWHNAPGKTDPTVQPTGQEQADPGNTDPGNTDPGNTDPGNTDPGNTDPGNTDPGNTDPGNTDPGNTVPDPAQPEAENADKPGETGSDSQQTGDDTTPPSEDSESNQEEVPEQVVTDEFVVDLEEGQEVDGF